MKWVRSGVLVAMAAVAAILFGCGGGEKESMVVEDGGTIAYVNEEEEFPLIVFGDGQQSLNDRCMVRQAKLNLRMPPVYVNSKPVGFC